MGVMDLAWIAVIVATVIGIAFVGTPDAESSNAGLDPCQRRMVG
jgi:hypothetical protein